PRATPAHAAGRPGRLPARHRRVDEIEAALLGLAVELARDLGRRGGVVDEHRALAHAGIGTLRPHRDLAHVVVVADAHHDEVLPGGGLLRGGGGAPAILLRPLLGLGGGAVVDGELVPALVLEMSGHGIAHDAQAEKRHLRHFVLLNTDCRGRNVPAGAPASTFFALARIDPSAPSPMYSVRPGP